VNDVRGGSVLTGLIWMSVISLLLFWLAVLGPLIAGFVGGRKSGGVGNAILAALLPSLLFGAALFALAAALTGLPVIGLLAGAGGLVLALSHVGPLLVGAVVGGALR